MFLNSIQTMIARIPLRPALLAVALVQTGVIVSIVRERMAILASPTVIELDVEPVDPRSFFRGDYVVLAYPAARFKVDDAAERAALLRAGQVYVTLVKDAAGEWRPVRVTPSRPAPVADGEVVVRARTDPSRRLGTTLALRYGIESYFVPEGTGREIEDAARAKAVRVKVAVARDGQVAIKGLITGGQVIEEPAL